MLEEIPTGFDTNLFLVKPSDDLICAICRNVFDDPRQCPNGHIFCCKCLAKSMTKHSNCPICKVNLSATNVGRNILAQTFIGELQTHCPSISKHKCLWTGRFVDRQQHYEKDCKYFQVKCVNTDCEQHFERRHLKFHAKTCPFEPSKCLYCHDSFRRKDIERHKVVDCVSRPTKCPKQKCKAIVPFNKIDEHLRFDCRFEMVMCPLHSLGLCEDCPQTKTKRFKLDRHVSDAVVSSKVLIDLAFKHALLKDTITSTASVHSAALSALEDENAKLRKQLERAAMPLPAVTRGTFLIPERAEGDYDSDSSSVSSSSDEDGMPALR